MGKANKERFFKSERVGNLMKGKLKLCGIYCAILLITIIMICFVMDIVYYKKPLSYNVKTTNKGFLVETDGQWKEFYVKGVNIGAALPGYWFTEFPEDKEVYLDWFKKIGEMSANSIRVYTLLPHQFYDALKEYNKKNKENPIWLFQEIWPDENLSDSNYLNSTYEENYKKEIRIVIDAVHGNARIQQRQGRAFGVYTTDISEYILGYMVGRELEPDEVTKTNEINHGYSFQGEYFSTGNDANPIEGWLAMNCDYLVSYEVEAYSNEHPVSIVSWPTLDPLEHDSEWNVQGNKQLEYNDKVSVDINHIDTESKLNSGFFGSYHIYPNYPDFMNNEDSYQKYYDEDGSFRYGGYLQEFIQEHTKYPALVAEFGVPTGMGNAHMNPDGLHHGGLTEEQQGEGIVRMMKTIKEEGYAGGLIFEWMDEWAKKTWMTEPFMIPYERHIFWHNLIDPEQNYGIMAMETIPPEKDEYQKNGYQTIKSIAMKHDSSYLYFTIKLARQIDFTKEELRIGIDTYNRQTGEMKFIPDSEIEAPFGMEFELVISSDKTAKLLVNPEYNITNNKFSSVYSALGIFEEMNMMINSERVTKDGQNIAGIYADCSTLNYGDFIDNSNYQWYLDGDNIYVRIPWNRLNFSDPSSMMVIDDSSVVEVLLRDKLKTTKSDGIMVSTLLYNKSNDNMIDLLSTEDPFVWSQWNDVKYKERLKQSYYIIKDYFQKLK